jgi:hypothetical protein
MIAVRKERTMEALTKVQLQDLRAINGNPGCYSRCREDGELMTLVNMGLIRWVETGGYEITATGKSALEKTGTQTRINRVADAIRDNIAAALPRNVSVDYRYAAIAAIAAYEFEAKS